MNASKWKSVGSAVALAMLSGCGTTSTPGGPVAPDAAPPPVDVRPDGGISEDSGAEAGTAPDTGSVVGEATRYDMGSPSFQEIYVSPDGNDQNTGDTKDRPLRTITAAWEKIPATPSTTTGYRINLADGTYPCEPGEPDSCNNYFSDRIASKAAPIVLRASGGQGKATVRGGMNFARVGYVYLLDIKMVGGGTLPTNSSGNNLLHIEEGDHVLLRGLTLEGPSCLEDSCNNLQEVLKVNQATYVYVEDSDISGAWHSAVDYFVVQHGHFLGNRVSRAGEWCMYIKGGTSYLTVEGNELFNCRLGFQSGQSANLAVMKTPWLQYETYDVRFVNNVLHDLPGVGFSAAGAYATLFAYNTLYRVGISESTAFGLAQFTYGERNCTATDELPSPMPECIAAAGKGGWGPTVISESLPAIPNRHVWVYNNVWHNPAPTRTQIFHFAVDGDGARPAGFVGPNPVRTDDDLRFAGNVIWNGSAANLDLYGSTNGTPSGCTANDSSCRSSLFTANNQLNTTEPTLVAPSTGNYRPGQALSAIRSVEIPPFDWADLAASPAVPKGRSDNTVTRDRSGTARPAAGPPGAYAK